MFKLIFNICSYILPFVGLIGFFTNNFLMMLVAIAFSIIQASLDILYNSAGTEQLKSKVQVWFYFL